jgi:hypothetical protein
MTTSHAVLGAAAAARAQAEGTGLKALAKNPRIIFIALFASLVRSFFQFCAIKAYQILGWIPLRLPAGSARPSLRHVFFSAEVPRRSRIS